MLNRFDFNQLFRHRRAAAANYYYCLGLHIIICRRRTCTVVTYGFIVRRRTGKCVPKYQIGYYYRVGTFIIVQTQVVRRSKLFAALIVVVR